VRIWIGIQLKELPAPKVAGTIVLPFDPAQVEAIIRACDAYPAKGIYGAGNRTRLRAFVLLLRYSGLRIGDVGRSKKRCDQGRPDSRSREKESGAGEEVAVA
jgi:integrase